MGIRIGNFIRIRRRRHRAIEIEIIQLMQLRPVPIHIVLCKHVEYIVVVFAGFMPLGVTAVGATAIDVYIRMAHRIRSEEHTSELQSRENLVCRLLLEKKKTQKQTT